MNTLSQETKNMVQHIRSQVKCTYSEAYFELLEAGGDCGTAINCLREKRRNERNKGRPKTILMGFDNVNLDHNIEYITKKLGCTFDEAFQALKANRGDIMKARQVVWKALYR